MCVFVCHFFSHWMFQCSKWISQLTSNCSAIHDACKRFTHIQQMWILRRRKKISQIQGERERVCLRRRAHIRRHTDSQKQTKMNRWEYYKIYEICMHMCDDIQNYLPCHIVCIHTVRHIRNKVENHTQMAKLNRSTCITLYMP